jgi:hypothetical protein
MQPPPLHDEDHGGEAILREAKDAADRRNNNAPNPPWWKFWAKPRSSEDDVIDER